MVRGAADGAAVAGPLRFRCLLLDHDDTTVRGTEEVHYPAHVESVRLLRPGLEAVSLEDWFERCHEPGVSAYLRSLFTTEQMKEEHEIWNRFVAARTPSWYEGMPELLARFRALGGKIAVVSHSPTQAIWDHYATHKLGEQICPDLVLGWDDDPDRRKPAPWPAHHAMQELGMLPSETLVVDDLSTGVKMGKSAGVAVAGAGWGHSGGAVEEYMRRESDFFFASVSEFADFLVGGQVAAAL